MIDSRLLSIFILLFCVAASAVATTPKMDEPGYWQTPAIEGYGRMHPRPDAAEQPNSRTPARSTRWYSISPAARMIDRSSTPGSTMWPVP